LALALDIALEIVDLLLEFPTLLVQGVGRHRRLLPLQRITFGPQRLFLMGNLLGVFVALLLNLAAHHLCRLGILQQGLDVDNHYGQGHWRRGQRGSGGCRRRRAGLRRSGGGRVRRSLRGGGAGETA
jgi:hypothetical protein